MVEEDGEFIQQVWARGEVHTGFWWGGENLKSTSVLGAIIFLRRSYTNQTTQLP
jgi:hypothetical protein